MKLSVMRPCEIEVDAVRVVVPVRYEEQDIPNNFPLRTGDVWAATIDIETGKIREWPTDAGAKDLHMKVCDEGCYYLMAGTEEVAKREQEYVLGFFPGIFSIDSVGCIKDWNRKVNADRVKKAFFTSEED